MRNIIIVTNSFEISGYYITKLKRADVFVPDPEGAMGIATSDDYARWVQVENKIASEMRMTAREDFKYNILRIPYEGFAWVVANNRTRYQDHENIVISTNEIYPTPIYAKRKAQFMIQGKYVPAIDDVEQWFDEHLDEGNILLSSLYDEEYEKFCAYQIPHTSSQYKYAAGIDS